MNISDDKSKFNIQEASYISLKAILTLLYANFLALLSINTDIVL